MAYSSILQKNLPEIADLISPKNRPPSAKHSKTPQKGKSTPKKRVKTSHMTLTKIKKLDKERIYEENLSLKLELSSLKDELGRSKAKLSALESVPMNKLQLVKTIKDLKCQIQAKDSEITQLKKNIKSSACQELEIEIQAYIDECTRLRHHLDEVMRQRESPDSSVRASNIEEIASLKKANSELHEQLRSTKDELHRWRERFVDKKKKTGKGTPKARHLERTRELEEKEEEIARLHAELRAKDKEKEKEKELEKLRIEDRDKDVTKIYSASPRNAYQAIEQTLQARNASFSSVIEQLSSKQPGFVKLEEFLEEFSLLRNQVIVLTGRKDNLLPAQALISWYIGDQISVEEVTEIFQHISYRMQLHRQSTSELVRTVLGKSFDPHKQVTEAMLKEKFKRSPFSFTEEEIGKLPAFLLQEGCTQKAVGEQLVKHTEDWDIFTSTDEDNFDRQLALVIPANKESLMEACKMYDFDNSGSISLEQLKKVLKGLKLDFPPSLIKYISLLFYSHSYKLDTVPYVNFISAYSEEVQEESEEEKAKIVRAKLSVIANHLNERRKTVREVFEADCYGLIYPKEFVDGLNAIGINNINQETIILMLEALQYEEEENMCMQVEELEDILEHYGVNLETVKREPMVSDDSVIVKDSSDDFSPRSI